MNPVVSIIPEAESKIRLQCGIIHYYLNDETTCICGLWANKGYYYSAECPVRGKIYYDMREVRKKK